MLHWTEHTRQITKKIAAIYKTLPKDYFVAGSKIIQDYECSKMMMQVDEETWQRVAELVKSKYGEDSVLYIKVNMFLCYINELRRLASINVRELTGLTRDDIAALQRLLMVSKSPLKDKNQTVEALIRLVSEFGDAEINDRSLLESANNHAVANIT